MILAVAQTVFGAVNRIYLVIVFLYVCRLPECTRVYIEEIARIKSLSAVRMNGNPQESGNEKNAKSDHTARPSLTKTPGGRFKSSSMNEADRLNTEKPKVSKRVQNNNEVFIR